MCPKIETLEYRTNYGRYDEKTKNILDFFLKKGHIAKLKKDKNGKCFTTTKRIFNPLTKSYRNICYLNKTRKVINKECCERFIKKYKPKIVKKVKFHYEQESEMYSICEKMPIIATKNLKDKNIYNTMEFIISWLKQINNEYFFTVNNEDFNEQEFAQSFIPSFCLTVYKYHGGEINTDYNIYDTNKMDKNQLYTALSRTTKFEDIHLDENMLLKSYYSRKSPELELVNAKKKLGIQKW